MPLKTKIYIAGHQGMVGSAIARNLVQENKFEIITQKHSELDLTNQLEVQIFFKEVRPEHVYLAAAKVGGIHANNSYPAEFIYQNLMIEANIINSAFLYGTKKLLFLGSSCIYPKFAPQSMNEEALLTSTLEETNEPYAIAKIAGIKLCESYNRQYGSSHGIDYRSVMPTNLYGQGDNYHSENSHVIPALIQRIHKAKIENKENVLIWGTGKPLREFLHVDDMAAACVFVMNLDKSIHNEHTKPMLSHINVGIGHDISIAELANTISKIIGFDGNVKFDCSKPDGTMRKLMDSSRLNNLGWQAKISLQDGLKKTYADFLKI